MRNEKFCEKKVKKAEERKKIFDQKKEEWRILKEKIDKEKNKLEQEKLAKTISVKKDLINQIKLNQLNQSISKNCQIVK